MANSIAPIFTLRRLNAAVERARYIGNRSKYMPHQGQREALRRRIGGFAGVANVAKVCGCTRTDAVAAIHNNLYGEH